jgi:hypothetical protein
VDRRPDAHQPGLLDERRNDARLRGLVEERKHMPRKRVVLATGGKRRDLPEVVAPARDDMTNAPTWVVHVPAVPGMNACAFDATHVDGGTTRNTDMSGLRGALQAGQLQL